VPKDDDDDLQEQVEHMADRLGLKGSDRQKYVHDHMTRGGYRAVPTYVPRDDKDDDDDDDEPPFFNRQRRRRTRDDSQDRQRTRSRGTQDDWYT
jgi:hypothetical protein